MSFNLEAPDLVVTLFEGRQHCGMVHVTCGAVWFTL